MSLSYPKPIILTHWITFILVVVAYLSSGNPTTSGLIGQVHVACGLSIFVLFFIRLGLIALYKKDIPENPIINTDQNRLFKIVKFMLYLSLCIVPIAGWLALSSLTDHFKISAFNLPLLSSVKGLASIGSFHQILGNLFITLVALHAVAALIHHFIFKDQVLKSMLFKQKK